MVRLILALALAAVALAAKPNIVLIVSDDQGYRDASFHGGTIRTPNIDRLAEEGVELERFYACPVCSPTRAGLMTGRYAIRFGMQRAVCRPFLEIGIPSEEEMLPEMLARAGYRHRGAVGKWHIGHAFKRFHPLSQGFTFFYGHYNGNIDYFTHERDGELDWHRGFEPSLDEGYSTDLIADEAVRFIRDHSDDEPFFLYVPFNAPHAPLQVTEKWLDAYASVADEDRRTYSAMVAAMDHGIGRILTALDEADVTDDTLVWFTSDNGGTAQGDNGALRAGKGTVYEGGIRVVSALRWPNGIEGGRKVGARLAYIDVWPTLRRVAGLDGDERPGLPLDGIDALDILRGKAEAPNRPLFSYYERYQGEMLAVIDGEWKLVRQGPPILGPNADDQPPAGSRNIKLDALSVELFRLSADPNETTNLADERPEVVGRLLAKLKEFRSIRRPGGAPPMTAPPPEGWKAPKNWAMRDE